MIRMKKFLATALVFALTAGTVLGAAPSTAFAAKTELVTVGMFGGADPAAEPYADLVDGFMKATGISVQDSSDVANEEWKASVLADFSTGNEPDVIFYFNGADAKPILKKVVDVATIKKTYPKYAADITDSALNAMKEADGKAYAVPVKGFWEGLYCNKDLFDKYGLDLPTDWDKMVKAIETFRKNGIDPISVSFAEEPHYLIESLILSAGGVKEHSANPKDPKLIPASWEKGLDMFKTLSDMKAFPADAATRKHVAACDAFYRGKAAMLVDGSWRTAGVINANRGDKVVVVPFPVIPDGKGTGNELVAGFSSGFYITKKAWNDPEKQKAAVDFVNYMTTKNAVKDLLAGGAGAPAANVPSNPNASQVLKTGTKVAGSASGTDMPIDSRLTKAAWTEIWTKVGDIASGKSTAKQVLEKAVSLNK